MVKKKDEVLESKLKGDSFTERILKEVEKDFGVGILVDAQTILDTPLETFSLGPNLDFITSGGVKESTFMSVSGPPKIGKTTLVLNLAAEAQKKGRMVYYDNVEGRLDEKNLKGIKGLDISPDKFYVFGSSMETKRVLTGKEHLQICEKVLTTHPGCMLIIDSISSFTGEKEVAQGLGTQMVGANNAVLVSQFVRTIKDIVRLNKCTIVGINKIMSNPGPGRYGPSTKEKGAAEFIYQCDTRLRAEKSEKWEVGEKIIGQIVTWSCAASCFGPPGMKTQSWIRYGIGIDKVYEAIDTACSIDLIRKAGSWYYLDFLDSPEEIKFQGLESVYQEIEANPTWLEKLTLKLSEFMGKSGCAVK